MLPANLNVKGTLPAAVCRMDEREQSEHRETSYEAAAVSQVREDGVRSGRRSIKAPHKIKRTIEKWIRTDIDYSQCQLNLLNFFRSPLETHEMKSYLSSC